MRQSKGVQWTDIDSERVSGREHKIGGEEMKNSLQRYNAGAKLMEWSERVAACRNSGIPVKAWCAQEGISEKSYYYWQRKVFLAAQGEEERFVEITGSSPVGGTVVATVTGKGLSAEIHSGADAETLRALLHAMRSC